jgi:hypothetical protein
MSLIPNQMYRAYDAINASLLKSVLSHSYWKAKIPLKPSAAMQLGTHIHCAVLEPEVFANTYTRLSDDINLRTNAGKAEKAEAEKNGGVALRGDEYDMIVGIAEQMQTYPEIRQYFNEDTIYEVSMTFEMDEYPGLEFKSQIDLYDPRSGVLLDLKTTADITRAERQFFDLHYALQLRFYQRALKANGYNADTVKVLFVEANPPHQPALFHLTESLLDVGESEICQAMARLLDERQLDKPRLIERTLDAPTWIKERK